MKRENLLISIPHAGTEIPDSIRSRMPHSDKAIRNESDLYTERIYRIIGVPTVESRYSRIIADPNRAPDEIYTEGIDRALGVVMLNLPTGESTFTKDPSLEEMAEWIKQYHNPYHDELYRKVSKAQFLIDGHSMWSKGAEGHYGPPSNRADIVLGNQYFCSCSAETTDFFVKYFEDLGYSVATNDPYPGRYILGTYCSRIHIPGIQIEINRKLYLDEATLEEQEGDINRLNHECEVLVDMFCEWFQGAKTPHEKGPVDLSGNTEY